MAAEIEKDGKKFTIYHHSEFCNGRDRACEHLMDGCTFCELFHTENEFNLTYELVKKNEKCLYHYQNCQT